MEKKITRGISEEFAEAFKKCGLYELYRQHDEELFIGVRNNYLNLYHNCGSIAKIEYKNKTITCEIDTYYLGNKLPADNGKINVEPCEICKNYDTIKSNSNKRPVNEKKALSKLVLLNNNNPESNWYCLDIEWAKAFENQEQKIKSDFSGRFDIIALSKADSHKVALIELKYGSDALGGDSGIYKHVEDFSKFQKKGYFESYLKQEIIDILESKRRLDIKTPPELQNLQPDSITGYEFYIITLNNNAESPEHSTPKQTMSGYLFNDKRWDCKRVSTKTVESEFGDVTNKSNLVHVKFLFSSQTLDNLTINDIIDGKYDERC